VAIDKQEPTAVPVENAGQEPDHADAAGVGEPQAESRLEAHQESEAAEHSAVTGELAQENNAGGGTEAAEAHPEQSHEAAALDHLHAFTPGDGQVEEEVIDEEEYDFAPLPEHAVAHDEEHDLSDLVEEETQASSGSEFGDVIREAQIDRQVISSDDDEFEDSDEEEGVEEEEPATAVASEEGAPAPRRGREDRQRGRERRGRGRNGRRQSAQMSNLPIISELLKQGQEILVQIAKEPIAKKGARITSHIALPGRFLVFMPTVNHVGVSRKIWSDEERQRLKRILISEKGEASGGFIVRTAAENASEEELRADLRFLISLWNEIKQRSDAAKAPALIYHDLNLVERILRDQVSDNFSTIWVDSEAEYERIVRFLNRFQPSLVRRVKLYTKETPLFEQFGIQDEITKALKSKVWLKSGGSIVINQTEALVAIDINTGKYVGKTARLEDTILKTNLDAIPEIVRQIRLRDLGGIIVIDFIDMDERKNRHKVMAALEEELKSDRAPSKVLQFNDFGLVAITRKRVKQSLERTLSVQCNICSGTGMVKSPTTVANEIYTEMRKMQKHFERHDVMLRVHPEVVKTLKGNNARWLNELEEMTGRTIIVKSDPALHPEQFDIH
jgi:ribonuclease E